MFVLCVQVVRLCARQGVCVWMCAGVMDGMRARVVVCVRVCICAAMWCVLLCGGGGVLSVQGVCGGAGVYVLRVCVPWCICRCEGDETRRAV